jgi:hypothetical protein
MADFKPIFNSQKIRKNAAKPSQLGILLRRITPWHDRCKDHPADFSVL